MAHKPNDTTCETHHSSITAQGAEIIARVEIWVGSNHEAQNWYRAYPIPAFGDRTAESLVKAGEEEAVRNYVIAVASGAFA